MKSARFKLLLRDVGDQFAKDCIVLFTKDTTKDDLQFKKIDKFKQLIESFKLDDIPVQTILDEGNQIKKAPRESLPSILQWNRIVTESFYDFLLLVGKSSNTQFMSHQYIPEMCPYIFRCLACISYQIENSIVDISHKSASSSIPYKIMPCLMLFMRIVALVPVEYSSSFLVLIEQIGESILRNIYNIMASNPEKEFLFDLLTFCAGITAVVSNDSLSSEHFSKLFGIIVSIFNAYIEFDKFNEDTLPFLGDFNTLVCQYYKSQSEVLESISLALSRLVTLFFNNVQKSQNISIKLIESVLSLLCGFVGSIQSTLDQVVSATFSTFKFVLQTKIEISDLKCSDSGNNTTELFNIDSNEYIEKHTCDPIRHDIESIDIIHPDFQSSLLYKVLGVSFNKLLELFELSEEFSHIFMKYLICQIREEKSILAQYFATVLYCSISPKLLTHLIANSDMNIWNYFVNDVSFSIEPIAGESPQLYKEITAWTFELIYNVYTNTNIDISLIIVNVCQYIRIDGPQRVKAICTLLSALSNYNPSKIISSLGNVSFQYQLVNIDMCYKGNLLHEPNNYYSEVRASILELLLILSKYPNFIGSVLNNVVWTRFSFSLLLEKDCSEAGLKLLKNLFRHPQAEQVLEFFKNCIDSIINSPNLVHVIIQIIDVFSATCQIGNHAVIQKFISLGMIQQYAKAVNNACKIEEDQGKRFIFVSKTISAFFYFCQLGTKYINALAENKDDFVSLIGEAIDTVKINEALADVMISFTLNETTSFQTENQTRMIQNTTGLWLLYRTTKNCPITDRIWAYLLAIISSSVENCWHCYLCGFLRQLLEDIPIFHIRVVFEVICAIGLRFFGMSELNILLRIMKHTEKSYTTQLMEMIFNMIKTRIRFPIATGFYVVGEISRYLTPVFSKMDRFTFTFLASPKRPNPIHVIKITSPKETISFYIGQNLIMRARLDPLKPEISYTHPHQLRIDKWNKVVFDYRKTTSTLKIDDHIFEIPDQILLTAAPITFEVLCRDKAISMIEDLSITHILYSLPKEKVIYSRSVPFPKSLADIIPLSGGPLVFLPFLEKVEGAADPQPILTRVIQIIGLTLMEDEDQAGSFFIRGLSHLLKHVPRAMWNEHNFGEVVGIQRKLKDSRLSQALLTHFFLDFEFLFSIEQLRQSIFMSILPRIFNEQKEQLKNIIDFDTFVVKLYSLCLFNSTTNSNKLIKAYQNYTDTTVLTLFGIAFRGNDAFNNEAIEQIYQIVKSNPSLYMKAMEEFDPIDAFFELARSKSERKRFWSMHLIFELYKLLPKERLPKFRTQLVSLLRDYPLNSLNDAYVAFALGFCYDEIQTMPDDLTPICSLNFTEPHPFVYIDFFPLFVTLSSLCKLKPKHFRDILMQTFSLDSARQEIQKVEGWEFWLAMSVYNCMEPSDFGTILGRIVADSRDTAKMQRAYVLLLLSCQQFGWEWHEVAGAYMMVLSELFFCTETVKLFAINMFMPNFYEYASRVKDFEEQKQDIITTAQTYYSVPRQYSFMCQFEGISLDQTGVDSLINIITKSTAVHTDMLYEIISFSDDIQITMFDLIANMIVILFKERPDKAKGFIRVILRLDGIWASVSPILLMLNSKNIPDESREMLINKLLEINTALDRNSVDDVAEKTKIAYHKLFERALTNLQVTISTLFEKIIKDGMNTFAEPPPVDALMSLREITEMTLSSFEQQEEISSAQMKRQNAKAWHRMWKNFEEMGGAWSVKEEDPHYKLDPFVDQLGRHFRLKKNRNYTQHKDASEQRDSGIKNPPKQQGEPFNLLAPRDALLEKTKYFQTEAQMITITLMYRGNLHLFKQTIVYETTAVYEPTDGEPKETEGHFKSKIIEIDISDIQFVLNRRYMHRDNGCEIFTPNASYFFFFPDRVRQQFYRRLKRPWIYIQSDTPAKVLKDFKIVEKWQSGKLSNFEYLYWLNIVSGRSYNDLNQYPVFPWVLSNYSSDHIDLSNPANYRDLSAPIGTLDKDRLEPIKFMYNEIRDPTMRCHYRVFYSTPAAVIGYLIRMEPFATLHIKLQSGQFDLPGRLFSSIPEAWNSVLHESSDYRELIPEFFSLPEFLDNDNHFDLGVIRATGQRVDSVALPPWAHSSAEFVLINRRALESPITTARLNQWVDLIFGYKQRGPEAEAAINIFHPFSYPSIYDLGENVIGGMLQAIKSHSLNFGVVPSVLFGEPSPPRAVGTIGITIDTIFRPSELRNAPPNATGVAFIGRTMATMQAQGRIVFSKFVKGELKPSLTVSFPSRFVDIFSKPRMLQKHVVFATERFLVLSAPTSNVFTVFDVSTEEARIVLVSRPHPGTISAIAADSVVRGTSLVVSVASVSTDSSFFLHTLEFNGSKLMKCSVVSTMSHSSAIIDVAVSATYDLVASIDERTLVYTSLATGKFINSAHLDRPPARVFITPAGYSLVISDLELEDGREATRLELYDMKCALLNTRDRLGRCTAQALHIDDNCLEHAALVFSDSSLAMMDVFYLDDVMRGEFPRPVVSAACSRELGTAVYVLDDGTMCAQQFIR